MKNHAGLYISNEQNSFIIKLIAKFENFIFRLAAIELNRKSQMVSEAVEEVLNLVQDATQTFKSMMSTDSDDITQG